MIKIKRIISIVLIIAMLLAMQAIEAFAVSEVQAVKIPDENFRKEILTSNDILGNRPEPANGQQKYDRYNIYSSDLTTLAKVKKLNLNNKIIKSLEGIEYFTSLETLYCANNYIENLDLSKNINLKQLYCYMNKLISLNLLNNSELQRLYCYGNGIAKINLSKNYKLTEIWATGNGPVLYVPDTDDIEIPVSPVAPIAPPANPPIQPEKPIVETKRPVALKISSVKRTKKQITILWTKPKDADGISIYKKKEKNEKYKLIKTIRNVNVTKYKAKRSKYKVSYLKFRAFKLVENKKIYGKYSRVIKL